MGQRLGARGWKLSHELGKEEFVRVMAWVAAKRGVKMGQRLGDRGWQLSHERENRRCFVVWPGLERSGG
jgi:hypothetical protein